MKNKVYVVTMDADWDCDYLAIYDSLPKVAKALSDNLADDFIFLNESDIKKHIKEREEKGAVWLFFPEDIDNTITQNHFNVRVAYIK